MNTPHSEPHDRRWFILLAIGVGTFMSALDGSVVSTILPVVGRAFHADVATVEWIVTVYLLVVSGLLLSFGRLGDLRGHRRIYVSGFALFIAASVLCGMAPTAWTLIAARGAQAVGAAMLFSNAPAILTRNFPANRLGQALGLQATMTYLGLTAGPTLGGWLAGTFGWRSVFYINVPVGGLALWLSTRYIPADHGAEGQERFDLAGAAVFLVGLIALLLGLNQGHAWGWLSPAILALLAFAVVMMSLFLALERRVAAPMLDLSLFSHRIFTASVVSALLNYICVSGVTFLLPFYLIQGRGLTPQRTGLLLSMQPIVMAITAPLSGTLSDRIGSRLPGALGMVILSGGLFLLARIGPHSPFGSVVGALCLVGLGTGIFISPNNSALMGAAPRGRQGIAAGILAMARNVGMVLGVGLAGAIYTSILAQGVRSGSPAPLYDAVSACFHVTAALAALGVLTTAVRGRTHS